MDNPAAGTVDQLLDAQMEMVRAFLQEDPKKRLTRAQEARRVTRWERIWRATVKAARAAATAEGLPVSPILTDIEGVRRALNEEPPRREKRETR